MTIEEGNKLIAEFCQCKQFSNEFTGNEITYTLPFPMFKKFLKDDFVMPDNTKYFARRLLFHLSWDWLMPVAEKIATLKDIKHIGISGTVRISLYSDGVAVCTIASMSSKEGTAIEATWLSIVDFIKWHNSKIA